MPRRRTPGPVTRTFDRLLREASDVVQGDLAGALGCDRSRIAHILAGDWALPADELPIWCDVIGSLEPLDVIARRLGAKVVPLERTAAPVTIQRGSFELLGVVGRFGSELASALSDGELDDTERHALRRTLVAIRESVEGLLANLPAREDA